MNSQQSDVTAFHEAFGHPAPAFPAEELTTELEAEFRRRAKWLHEEADELIEACDEKDLVKALDALIDSKWFATGGFVVSGHDEDAFWVNVAVANMAKLGPDGQPILSPEDGKIMKPEGWVPPEAAHAVTLERIVQAARMESVARQIAWIAETNPGGTITIPEGVFTADMLSGVFTRARDIGKNGEAEKLYREMEAEIAARSAS